MPRGDRTGLMGLGAMTGRGAGHCTGFGMPGNGNVLQEGGFGAGSGWGRGVWRRGFVSGGRAWRKGFYATGLPGWMRFGRSDPLSQEPDRKSEKRALRSQAEALQSQLEFLKKRLSEMEGKAGE